MAILARVSYAYFMLEPLLLTVAAVTVPFGLYLAFDRKKTEQRIQKRINRHERTRQALQRLSQLEEHWNPGHLRFELRQNYRSIQKLRLAGDWDALTSNVAFGPIQEWRAEWDRREKIGVRWVLDPMEIDDVATRAAAVPAMEAQMRARIEAGLSLYDILQESAKPATGRS